MKDFIKKSLALTAIIILTIYTVSSIRFGNWKDTLFVWELSGISVLLYLVLYGLNYLKNGNYLVELLLEYVVVSVIVAIAGLLLGWFEFSFIWHVPVYVTPIYVVVYLLDLNRTRRDVDFINKKIQERREGIKKYES